MKKTEAIKIAGGKAKLARLLNVTKGAVSQWGDMIPELRALQLEKLVNGTEKSSDEEKA